MGGRVLRASSSSLLLHGNYPSVIIKFAYSGSWGGGTRRAREEGW